MHNVHSCDRSSRFSPYGCSNIFFYLSQRYNPVVVDRRNSRAANRASQGEAWPTITLLAWRSDRDDGTTREIRARKYRRVLTTIAGIFRVTSGPCVFSCAIKRMSTTGTTADGPLTSTLSARQNSTPYSGPLFNPSVVTRSSETNAIDNGTQKILPTSLTTFLGDSFKVLMFQIVKIFIRR